jgi:alkyldihydroxyacetonephosphate synthase
MVLGLRMAAPAGDIALVSMPASAAGPGLRELIVGSEGTLGVIDEVSLRVRHLPAERRYEGVMFESFAAGVHALRAMAQEHAMPEVARLSDAAETRMSMALAGGGGLKGRLGRAYLGARGRGDRSKIGQRTERCIAILGFEGDADEVKSRRGRALGLARREGGVALGGSPGRTWLQGRFQAPYLRDDLLSHGVMVETLETATRWSNLERLHDAVAGAIERALAGEGTPGIVMCHVSHLYETGASLYYTLIARQREGSEIEQWRTVKRAASEAIVSGGGTITHHHAVGRDHAPWLAREVGEQGVSALRALKEQLDPTGIMNPGKLLP